MTGSELVAVATGCGRFLARPARPRPDRLIFGLSAADAFFLSTDVGFIHLHTAVKPIPAGPDYCHGLLRR